MSWFKRSRRSSGTSSTSVTPNSSPSTTVKKYAKQPLSSPLSNPDTAVYLDVFRNHWKQVWNILQPISTPPIDKVSDEVETVLHNIEQMMNLLIAEECDKGMPGQILHYLMEHSILEKFGIWCSAITDYTEKLLKEQLKLYETIISQSKQLLLIHKPIIQPLMDLLTYCSDYLEQYKSVDLQQHLILLLHQLCLSISQQTLILDSFFHYSSDQGSVKFLLFSLLIPYVHSEENIGQQARDALLLVMAISARNDSVGRYIALNSDFCPVLATGLSGLYSGLPRKLSITSDDWHRLTDEDVASIPDLQMFVNSLQFCNAVAQVAHPLVRDQLITFIYNGFLVPVVGPALHQPSRDEIIAATAYLELFISKITEPVLLKAFLKFILSAKYDDVFILDSLIARVNSSSALCVMSLSLFQTIINLNCEDVMFQLIFKYLMPCSHVMVSQRRAVKELDLYSKSAKKFLCLRPSVCAHLNDDESANLTHNSSINSHWSSDSISLDSTLTPPTGINNSYMDYLDDAHSRIRSCAQACQGWSARYNGENPAHDLSANTSMFDTSQALSDSVFESSRMINSLRNSTFDTDARSYSVARNYSVTDVDLQNTSAIGSDLHNVSVIESDSVKRGLIDGYFSENRNELCNNVPECGNKIKVVPVVHRKKSKHSSDDDNRCDTDVCTRNSNDTETISTLDSNTHDIATTMCDSTQNANSTSEHSQSDSAHIEHSESDSAHVENLSDSSKLDTGVTLFNDAIENGQTDTQSDSLCLNSTLENDVTGTTSESVENSVENKTDSETYSLSRQSSKFSDESSFHMTTLPPNRYEISFDCRVSDSDFDNVYNNSTSSNCDSIPDDRNIDGKTLDEPYIVDGHIDNKTLNERYIEERNIDEKTLDEETLDDPYVDDTNIDKRKIDDIDKKKIDEQNTDDLDKRKKDDIDKRKSDNIDERNSNDIDKRKIDYIDEQNPDDIDKRKTDDITFNESDINESILDNKDVFTSSVCESDRSMNDSFDVSQCNNLDTFMQYLNTVDVSLSSVPSSSDRDIDSSIRELDSMLHDISINNDTFVDSEDSISQNVLFLRNDKPVLNKNVHRLAGENTVKNGNNSSFIDISQFGDANFTNLPKPCHKILDKQILNTTSFVVIDSPRHKQIEIETDDLAKSSGNTTPTNEIVDEYENEINHNKTDSQISKLSTNYDSPFVSNTDLTCDSHTKVSNQTCDSNARKSLSLKPYQALVDDSIVSLTNSGRGTSFIRPEISKADPPCIGPFLSALFTKLELMMQNGLYVNLLLTDLISRIACYPQPLLRSFLLSHNLVFQPSVKSLVQVLGSVRQKVDSYLHTVPNIDHLLTQARTTLVWHEHVYMASMAPSPPPTTTDDLTLSVAGLRSIGSTRPRKSMSLADLSSNAGGERRRSGFAGRLFRRSPNRRSQGVVLEATSSGKGYHFINVKGASGASKHTSESPTTINAVYCAIVLEEFMKELAALSQEHSVLSLDDGYHSN